jgi:hypothetical protein
MEDLLRYTDYDYDKSAIWYAAQRIYAMYLDGLHKTAKSVVPQLNYIQARVFTESRKPIQNNVSNRLLYFVCPSIRAN